mgnify:FL=1|jgi:hypothetical protein
MLGELSLGLGISLQLAEPLAETPSLPLRNISP